MGNILFGNESSLSLLVSMDFDGHVVTDNPRGKHNLPWNTTVSPYGSMCLLYLSLVIGQAIQYLWKEMQNLSHHMLYVRSKELVALKFCPQGRKGRRLCSFPLLLLIKCSCVLQQEVLLSWMNGCVERQEARTYGLKNV